MISHVPVLLEETIEFLRIQPQGCYIDCTLGTAGHAAAILERSSPDGKLLGIDVDPKAVEIAKKRLQTYNNRALLVNKSYKDLEDICTTYNFQLAQGILFDLGISSLQLDEPKRGFSFRFDASLDMRFNPEQSLTASTIINTFSETEIASILERYGEERYHRRIASKIVACRPINTTLQLVGAIEQAIGKSRGKIHPATRTFQALRITVNQELTNLEIALKQAVSLLDSGGRLVVISYHSLEDRLVKEFMRQEAKSCICPPDTPVCGCNHTPTLKLVNRKTVVPSVDEKKTNPRSRSAKLRAVEHL